MSDPSYVWMTEIWRSDSKGGEGGISPEGEQRRVRRRQRGSSAECNAPAAAAVTKSYLDPLPPSSTHTHILQRKKGRAERDIERGRALSIEASLVLLIAFINRPATENKVSPKKDHFLRTISFGHFARAFSPSTVVQRTARSS